VQALLARGAGVAVIAHQGRPGGEDFTDLSEHAAILAELLDREVDHVEDVEGSAALDAVEQLQPEQVLVLGNVRASEGETQSADPGTHGRRAWVRRLGQRADVYVNDAFPACHRAHASIVGFPARMPAVAGPGLVDELEALTAIGERDPPRVAVLGGAKAGKSLELVGHQLARDRVDEVCLGGLLAVPFLAAEGVEIGEGTQALLGEDAAVYRRRARTLLDGHADRIQLPEDVAVRRDGDRFEVPVDELADGRIRDIGTDTANSFADRLSEAETLLVHGPMGVYEEARFARGTRRVFAQAAETSGYKVVGGGHTVHALEDLGIDRSGFDHVSLAGGALLSHLAGEELPGLAALKGSPRQRVH
jgi:phosphoglycerate kinase